MMGGYILELVFLAIFSLATVLRNVQPIPFLKDKYFYVCYS
jgi:hypothetical protein